MPARLAYFGPPGTNAEEAAIKYSASRSMVPDLVPVPTITAVGMSVENGEADEAVMPIENSLEGAVAETLDFLVHTAKRSVICGEVVLLIDHYLLAKPGVKAEQVKVITSMPQALAQCRGYIEKNFPGARVEAAMSTAAAVEDVMTRDDAAAIGNRRAAAIYGAEVLANQVQDRSPNHTRFVVVAPQDHEPTGDDRTSLAFAFANEDRPGQLVGALQEFSSRGINLSKIESRPSRERLGTYIFLVDLAGHRTDLALAAALSVVEGNCSFFRVLGSYPRDRGD
jgi:prephenate dehydratase